MAASVRLSGLDVESWATYPEASHDGLQLLSVQLADSTIVAVEDVQRVRGTLDDAKVLQSSKRTVVEVKGREGLTAVGVVSVEVFDLVERGRDIAQAESRLARRGGRCMELLPLTLSGETKRHP